VKTYRLNDLTLSDIAQLCRRPRLEEQEEIRSRVTSILEDVQREGDNAVQRFARQYDRGERLVSIREEWDHVIGELTSAERDAMDFAFENIQCFHTRPATEEAVEVRPGVRCWREWRPIGRVGLYIPGGSAPLPSTLMMLGIPARVAGCPEIIVCTPPNSKGQLPASMAYVAKKLNLDCVFLVGGAQAIAAMAYGTESIPRVEKIFGPGNRFVTHAKLLVQSDVAIDLPAGPSELLIIADASARTDLIAADLLAQAEHGPDSQCVLVTTNERLAESVSDEIARQLNSLSRRVICEQSLEHFMCITANELEAAMAFSNSYAPEHLSLHIAEPDAWTSRVQNAGSVFCGSFSPEAAGDYASGPNHTLPTGGWARAHSGVGVESFMKRISFQSLSRDGLLQLSDAIESLARMETLDAHGHSIRIRRTL
jgi:histidinol dehydrogenase